MKHGTSEIRLPVKEIPRGNPEEYGMWLYGVLSTFFALAPDEMEASDWRTGRGEKNAALPLGANSKC